MLFIIGKEARSAIAVVDHLVADALQPLDEARSAVGGWCLLATWSKGGGAGRRANQGDFLRLTDDFDRQGLAPCLYIRARRVGRLGLTAGGFVSLPARLGSATMTAWW